jgi:hypothetical protein
MTTPSLEERRAGLIIEKGQIECSNALLRSLGQPGGRRALAGDIERFLDRRANKGSDDACLHRSAAMRGGADGSLAIEQAFHDPDCRCGSPEVQLADA